MKTNKAPMKTKAELAELSDEGLREISGGAQILKPQGSGSGSAARGAYHEEEQGVYHDGITEEADWRRK